MNKQNWLRKYIYACCCLSSYICLRLWMTLWNNSRNILKINLGRSLFLWNNLRKYVSFILWVSLFCQIKWWMLKEKYLQIELNLKLCIYFIDSIIVYYPQQLLESVKSEYILHVRLVSSIRAWLVHVLAFSFLILNTRLYLFSF